MMKVFTPLTEDRRVRLNFANVQIISGDPMKRHLGRKGQVLIEGHQFEVVGISCGGNHCNCDAYIRR
jgi:hypothetical protein